MNRVFRIFEENGLLSWRYKDDGGPLKFVKDDQGDDIFTDLHELTSEEMEGLVFLPGAGITRTTEPIYSDLSGADVIYFPISRNVPLSYRAEQSTAQIFYVKDGNFLRPQEIDRTKSTGGGGFGAVRSDEPGEYIWYGNKLLGYALDLRLDWYKSDSPPQSNSISINGHVFYRTNTPALLAEDDAGKGLDDYQW